MEKTTLTQSCPTARVLIVAGSDSSGGAGIQADLKTVMAFGGYAGTALTALTAQDTFGVAAIEPASPALVRRQMELFLEDIGADAVKTGMLFSAEIIRTAVGVLARHAEGIPLVVDPVMAAGGGARLLQEEAVAALISDLFPLASVVTPNIPEAEIITGQRIKTPEDMRRAAERMLERGAGAVLLKGGHLAGDTLYDLLMTRDGIVRFYESGRIATRHTHGTGCTLASGLATLLGQGKRLQEAVPTARDYVRRAIEAAPGFGRGQGPLGHAAAIS